MSKGARSCRYAGDLEPAYWRDTADNLVPVNMGGIAMEENTERDEVYEQFMQDLQAKKKRQVIPREKIVADWDIRVSRSQYRVLLCGQNAAHPRLSG